MHIDKVCKIRYSSTQGEVAEWSIAPVLPDRVGSALGGKTATMYYVYILKSKKTAKLYKGSTEDLKNRLNEHNRGKVKSTKSGCPWGLVYYEAFENKKLARREELFLKTGKGRERVKFLLEST